MNVRFHMGEKVSAVLTILQARNISFTASLKGIGKSEQMMARCAQSYTSNVIINNYLKRTEEGYLELLQVQDSRSTLPRLRGWAIREEIAY